MPAQSCSARPSPGCATTRDPVDPFEPFNRGVYRFNDRVDKAVLQPTARAYRAVLPQFVRTGVANFFSNIGDVRNVLNSALQGNVAATADAFGRVAINSTIGLLGVLDVASEAGLEKRQEDFGLTLASWGFGDGPFLMLPLLGPSSGRDAVGTVVDYLTDPVAYVDPTRAQNQLWGGRVVEERAELLDASTIVRDAALDPYLFIRDGYLQRRRALARHGVPPPALEAMYREARDDSSAAHHVGATTDSSATSTTFERNSNGN